MPLMIHTDEGFFNIGIHSKCKIVSLRMSEVTRTLANSWRDTKDASFFRTSAFLHS